MLLRSRTKFNIVVSKNNVYYGYLLLSRNQHGEQQKIKQKDDNGASSKNTINQGILYSCFRVSKDAIKLAS